MDFALYERTNQFKCVVLKVKLQNTYVVTLFLNKESQVSRIMLFQ